MVKRRDDEGYREFHHRASVAHGASRVAFPGKKRRNLSHPRTINQQNFDRFLAEGGDSEY